MDESKLYVLHCNKCTYKKFSNGKDIEGLILVKQSSLQRNLPKLDIINKKIVSAPDKKRNKLFKCPKCGFTMKAYQVEENKENLDESSS